MTASLEEYLKTIYILICDKGSARVTDIADMLGYKKPSVNRALKILKEEGLIDYEAYKDIKLTNKGKILATDIVRKHNALKAFLIEVLNVEEDKAEEEAKHMKHAISESTLNSLEEYIQTIVDVEKFVCNYNPKNNRCKKCINQSFKKRIKLKKFDNNNKS